MTALDVFRQEVNRNIAVGDIALPVTGIDGSHPVVVALEDEAVSTVLGRLRATGGFANLFVRTQDRVCLVSVVAGRSAIYVPAGETSPDVTAFVTTLDNWQHTKGEETA